MAHPPSQLAKNAQQKRNKAYGIQFKLFVYSYIINARTGLTLGVGHNLRSTQGWKINKIIRIGRELTPIPPQQAKESKRKRLIKNKKMREGQPHVAVFFHSVTPEKRQAKALASYPLTSRSAGHVGERTEGNRGREEWGGRRKESPEQMQCSAKVVGVT